MGLSALFANTGGSANSAVGYKALYANTSGYLNTAHGIRALYENVASRNTAVGAESLNSNTTGHNNVAVGQFALSSNGAGSYNIAVGSTAGSLTTADHNILVGNAGVVAESGAIRIGAPGVHTQAFIAGISGNTTGLAGVTVLVDANGELGTISSSRRFKQDIELIGSASERILQLRPVAFRYKKEIADGEPAREYGLIAEEVAEVFPELVVNDDEGRPYTVRYHLLVPLLLSELQRQRAEYEAQWQALANRLEAVERERRRPGA